MKPVDIKFLRLMVKNANATYKAAAEQRDLATMQRAIMLRESAYTAIRMFQAAYSANDTAAIAAALQFCASAQIPTQRSSAENASEWQRITKEYGTGALQLVTDVNGNLVLGEHKIPAGYRHTATGTVRASFRPHVTQNEKHTRSTAVTAPRIKSEVLNTGSRRAADWDKAEILPITDAAGVLQAQRAVIRAGAERHSAPVSNDVRTVATLDAQAARLLRAAHNPDVLAQYKQPERMAAALRTKAEKLHKYATTAARSQQAPYAARYIKGTIQQCAPVGTDAVGALLLTSDSVIRPDAAAKKQQQAVQRAVEHAQHIEQAARSNSAPQCNSKRKQRAAYAVWSRQQAAQRAAQRDCEKQRAAQARRAPKHSAPLPLPYHGIASEAELHICDLAAAQAHEIIAQAFGSRRRSK